MTPIGSITNSFVLEFQQQQQHILTVRYIYVNNVCAL